MPWRLALMRSAGSAMAQIGRSFGTDGAVGKPVLAGWRFLLGRRASGKGWEMDCNVQNSLSLNLLRMWKKSCRGRNRSRFQSCGASQRCLLVDGGMEFIHYSNTNSLMDRGSEIPSKFFCRWREEGLMGNFHIPGMT